MSRRSIVLTLVLLLGVAGVLPAATSAQQEPEPVFNVEPRAGTAGTRFAFMATGFLGYERVGVWLNDPDGRAVEARAERLDPATGFGRVDWFWTAPNGIRAGTWQMVALGTRSGVQRIIPIEIGTAPAPGPPPPEVPGVTSNVNPREGLPGTRFAFMATGFRPGEPVGVWINTPDGQPLPAAAEQLNPANRDGRADWFWTAPAYLRAGTWQMLARGTRSGLQRTIVFEIR
jgi:hypothetical protein